MFQKFDFWFQSFFRTCKSKIPFCKKFFAKRFGQLIFCIYLSEKFFNQTNMENTEDINALNAEIQQNKATLLNRYSNEEKYFNAIKEKYAVPFVYNSLVLSGTSVTKNSVKNTVTEGFGDEETETETANEILELYEAYQKIFSLSKQETLTEENIKGLHKVLFSRSPDVVAGKYQADKSKVIALKIKDFLEWFNGYNEDNISEFAALAYQKYIYIHPFKGGNGKMARLIMNLAALKKGFPLIIIPAEEQSVYDSLIKESKESTEKFIKYISKCALNSMNIILKSDKDVYSSNKKRHLRNVDCSGTVLKAIQDTPGIKIMQIKELVSQISFIKLQRIIADFRKQGLVEFRGPLRSGGYYFIKEEKESSQE